MKNNVTFTPDILTKSDKRKDNTYWRKKRKGYADGDSHTHNETTTNTNSSESWNAWRGIASIFGSVSKGVSDSIGAYNTHTTNTNTNTNVNGVFDVTKRNSAITAAVIIAVLVIVLLVVWAVKRNK